MLGIRTVGRTILVLGMQATLALLFAAPASADAGAVVVTHDVLFAAVVPNTCTGEQPIFSGYIHMEEHTSLTGASHTQFSVQNVKGEVTITGVRYVGTQASSETLKIAGPGARTETLENRFTLTRLGEDGTFIDGDDWHVKSLLKITTNANGVVTAFQVEGFTECR